ncbi:MAG: extensin family protein [Myxococcales bacterium]|nr:extensin family protein [Myxococcales bacterium]
MPDARPKSSLFLTSVCLVALGACTEVVVVERPAGQPAPEADGAPPPQPEPEADAAPEPEVDAAPALPCLEDLTQRNVPFTKAQARGVVDAIVVNAPINGVVFASEMGDKPTTQPMACEFVRTLFRFAEVLKSKGIHKVGTLGSYCYRCCCSWSETNFCRGVNDPEPSCGSNGYSNHSFGRAVDVRYLTFDDGRTVDINKDTDFKATAGGTCGAARTSQTGTSKTLYDIVCETAALKIFSTVLTPNYNSDHRNHWHMDTGQSGNPKSTTVRSLGEIDVDRGDHPDSCGE